MALFKSFVALVFMIMLSGTYGQTCWAGTQTDDQGDATWWFDCGAGWCDSQTSCSLEVPSDCCDDSNDYQCWAGSGNQEPDSGEITYWFPCSNGQWCDSGVSCNSVGQAPQSCCQRDLASF